MRTYLHALLLYLALALCCRETAKATPSDLLGGRPVGESGWSYSFWYGHFYEAGGGWIYHLDHGWQYVPDGEAGATWVWDQEIGAWSWIHSESYPWIYMDSEADWAYFSAYSRRESDPRWFVRASDGHWVNDRGQDLDELVSHAWVFAEAQLAQTVQDFNPSVDRYPYQTDPNGRWTGTNRQTIWTAGYFPACMWYLYEHTGDEPWRELAEAWSAPIKENTNFDLAVRYFYSYGRGWQLTGNEAYWDRIVESVDLMIDRWWVENLQSFQSWERDWSRTNHAVVTDMAIHMQPFFAVGRATGDAHYFEMAKAELDAIIDLNIRDDGSTIHFTDLNSNGSIRGINNTNAYQGYRTEPVNSVWSRAQAWAVMGFPMAYRYTEEERYLDAARQVADYFIQELPEDHVPPSSFRPLLNGDSKDSSAAAIAAVGLKELADQTGDPYYANAYRNILLALTTDYLAEGTGFPTILYRACHHTGAPEVGAIYADAFFLEALLAYESEVVYELLPEDVE